MIRQTAVAALVTVACFHASVGSPQAPATSPSRDTIVPTDSSVVVLAAGDIAACTDGSVATARLLDSMPGQILVPGDAAYWSMRNPDPYRTCYDSTWGRHKARTRVVPGNHDSEPRVLRRFYSYFGEAAGAPDGFFSFDLGQWHIIALNSNVEMARSKQGRWLDADLAQNKAKCTLVFMHHPRFSSGPHTVSWGVKSVFDKLHRAGVDVLVSGHDHIYERFAPMDPDGKLADNGIRQFIAGTGGYGLYAILKAEPNSESRSDQDIGILKLTLHPDSYDWEFVPIISGFQDSGSGRCH